jgi:prepilin-type N-terminal cleavage/methylation domain-containing protein
MNKYNRGFSLIELAVSVIIIGLLVGGIASGTKLIAQAELRGFIAQMDQHKADYNAFKLEYNAVAGDMKDASTFFTGCAVVSLSCNGNGDGLITLSSDAGDEPVKFFRHLNLSGINTNSGMIALPSNYDPYSNAGNTTFFPKGRILGSAFMVSSVDAGGTGGSPSPPGTIVSDSTLELASNFPFYSTVVFAVKADGPVAVLNGAMPALLAHNIDRKMDDGDSSGGVANGANTGKVRTINDRTGANFCVSTNTYNIATIQSTCVIQSLIK